MAISTLILVVGLVTQAFSYPSDPFVRVARQSSSAGAVAGAGTGATSTTSGESSENGRFGIGAAAGIGGIGRQAGIGSFNADTKSSPFLPWGAFAGMNLGSGGRIGAGCSGLSCGVQLGNFAIATPQLLGLGQNFLNTRQQQQSRTGFGDDLLTSPSNYYDNSNPYSYNDGYYNDYNNPSYNYPQSFPSSEDNGNSNRNGNFDPFSLLQRPFQFVQQFQQRYQGGQNPQDPQNVGNFARFGGGNGFFNGAATSSTFGSSSNGNGGRPVFSSTSTHVDSDGKVTTIESGSDQADKITTGRIGNNNGGGVYAASGTNVDSDGKVTNFKDSGTF